MNIVSNFKLLLKKVMNFFTNGRNSTNLTNGNQIVPKVEKKEISKESKKIVTNSNNGKTVISKSKHQMTECDKDKNTIYKQKTPVLETSKPYTIQAIPFLKTDIIIDYSRVYKVNYSISDSDGERYPIVRVPKKGCEIKLPVKGRSGKRGVCEQKLCDTIYSLGLKCFYDCFSLFVGSYTVAYEPDLVYIDLSKSIFIDIEIDEPYAGWERMPIHYKTPGGTIDDKRNDCFTERGWTVIRFTEKQVYMHPKSCLKYVYQQLAKINPSISIPSCFNNVDDLGKDNMWTEEEAKRKIEQKEREKMLGISEFIMPNEHDKANPVKDYPEGKKIEASIIRKKQSLKHINDVSYIKQKPSISTHPEIESDKKRQTEALQYELPQRVTTKSSFKTTPSSRGYA